MAGFPYSVCVLPLLRAVASGIILTHAKEARRRWVSRILGDRNKEQ